MAIGLLVYNGPSVQADTAASANAVVQRDNQGGITGKNVQGTNLQTTGSLQLVPPPTKTTAFTVDNTSTVWICDATGAAFTVTLPPAATVPGMKYTFVRKNSGSNAVTIAGSGSENINGANTSALSSQYAVLRVISDGSQFWAI